MSQETRVFFEIGPPTLTIMIAGKPHYFEDHRVLGPMACTKHGDGIKGTNTFWYAVTCWAQQGREIKDGVCVWKPTIPSAP